MKRKTDTLSRRDMSEGSPALLTGFESHTDKIVCRMRERQTNRKSGREKERGQLKRRQVERERETFI